MDNSIWRRPQDEPADRQRCNIVLCGGMLCSVIVCNIVYVREWKGWIDLFAAKQQGDVYPANTVSAWMPAELIPPVPAEFLVAAEAAQLRKEEEAQAATQKPESGWRTWFKFLHR